MLSNKGAVQFYIVSILLILIAGFVSILVYSEISYGILNNQGNSACTLRNAFQNMYTGDDIVEQALDMGNSNCKVVSETLRPPDITNTNRMFDMCKGLIEYYQGNYELAKNDQNFGNLCLSYALIDRSNSCWNTYLKGNAKFSGECNRICLSNGFRSYKLDKPVGEIYVPNTNELDVKISNTPVNQYTLKFQDIGNLYDPEEIGIKITPKNEGELIKISYEKAVDIQDKDFYLVNIVDLELNSNSLSEMITLYSSINELGPYDNILFDPNINYNSGDQIILGFVESTDINLLEAGVKTISVLQRNQPLYTAGAILGEFEFGNAKLSENYIYYERRGQC